MMNLLFFVFWTIECRTRLRLSSKLNKGVGEQFSPLLKPPAFAVHLCFEQEFTGSPHLNGILMVARNREVVYFRYVGR
jgi:hypothetical protein